MAKNKKNQPHGQNGKPKKCDKVPQSSACKKTQKHQGMYCKDCSYCQH